MQPIRAVKGMNDILPAEMPAWRRVEEGFRRLSARYGYSEVRLPVVEPTALFVRGVGETTDIVEKEMYTFVDKGEHSLTLRPEGTASAVRAYVQHAIHGQAPVTKWTYLGPMYRRERPARGRYRQFYQLGAEAFGDAGPHIDAELIEMLVRFLRELDVDDVEVLLNSLGSGETRERYRKALVAYLEPRRSELSADSQRRVARNPLRVLDSKAEEDRQVAAQAPNILGFLSAEDRAHFDELCSTLDALDVPHRVEPTLVRGLDYYTRTLFEVKGRGGALGAQDTICGGGRYDDLVQSLGGPSTPAVGFAVGVERLLLTLGHAAESRRSDAFVVTASPDLRREASVLLRDLRDAGITSDADLRGRSLKSQMRRADKSGARVALILGDEEQARGVVQVRDLVAKVQVEVKRSEVIDRTRRIVVGTP